jgi:beta-phosphoglucomutase-like phosphatase (HAD superfamily)
VTGASAERPFGLVIFDCDGVLVDSERLALRLDAELRPAISPRQ